MIKGYYPEEEVQIDLLFDDSLYRDQICGEVEFRMQVTDPPQPDFVTISEYDYNGIRTFIIANEPTSNEHIGEDQDFWVEAYLVNYPTVVSVVNFKVTVNPCYIEDVVDFLPLDPTTYIIGADPVMIPMSPYTFEPACDYNLALVEVNYYFSPTAPENFYEIPDENPLALQISTTDVTNAGVYTLQASIEIRSYNVGDEVIPVV